METKRAIANIVTHVFHHYRFSSLPEYNGALRQFGVVADRGKEGGRIYQNGGLVYRLLDEGGAKVGVPIKASSLPCRPTLKALEQKFTGAETLKTEAKTSLKNVLDKIVAGATSLKALEEQLAKQKIYTLPRQNSEGRIYGITFVDNGTKCVFNGSDLGKDYSAAAILARLSRSETGTAQKMDEKQKDCSSASDNASKQIYVPEKKEPLGRELDKLSDILLPAKEHYDNVPGNLLPKKRKKKKRINPNSSL